ncbi:glutathione peroxidase [Candidatus Saccharibacteria bacterium]|nr:glutathione peroxidase [Candidatus Saccharibacteria bacterium]
MKIYDFKVPKRDGSELDLKTLEGKVILVVNTATGCGFTPQYEGLETLYEKYHETGLEILDFPCDQFGHQAPGTDEEIHTFCTGKYKTKFDQLKKIEVNGDKAEPIFSFLKGAIPEEEVRGMKNKLAMGAIDKMVPKAAKEKGYIRWNFTKFLISRTGEPAFRYAPTTNPLEFEDDIKKLLGVN